MLNILIFGGSGKLGKNWIENLVTKNKVYANIHLSGLKLKHKNLIKQKLNKNNKKKIREFLNNNKINLIINCIALTNIEECEKNKKKSTKLNYLIPAKISDFAKKLNIRFIHISTDMLYLDKNKKKSENSKLQSHNHYSKMKIKAEKYIGNYDKSLIIRTNFFGYSYKNNMTFSDRIIFNLYKNRKIYLWDNIFFNPMYIGNLILIINFLIKKNKFGIYNISSNECISKYELGLKIADLLNLKRKNIKKNKVNNIFINRPNYMCTSNKKLLKQFPLFKKDLSLNIQLTNFKKDFSRYGFFKIKR